MSSPEFKHFFGVQLEKSGRKPAVSTEIVELTIIGGTARKARELISSTFHPKSGLVWKKKPDGVYQAQIQSKDNLTKFYSIHMSKPNILRIVSSHPTHRSIDELLDTTPAFFPPKNCIVGLWPHIRRKQLDKAAYDVIVTILKNYSELSRSKLQEEKGLSFPDYIIPVPFAELARKQSEIEEVIEMVVDDINKLTKASLDLLSK